MPHILIVEDERHLAEGLRFNLEAEGFTVTLAETGEAALELLSRENDVDLIVLDVMLPGKSGFEVAAELRHAKNYLPILMLTARALAEDVLAGFAAGADDYLPKPFDLAILVARIHGLLRRRKWLAPAADAPPDVYAFQRRVVDFARLEIQYGERRYPLTLMEANLLRYLVQREGRPVSRKVMLAEVWDLREETDTRAIDNFIVRLRKYLEDEPAHPRHLLTVRGVGYQFVANPR
ncbi:MAG TPA: response regulator transcription factor [Terriglobales bacterium]|nr:response regulator transcription factor [Terriglobales bacterium]